MRRRHRSDANQSEIVAALRAVGCAVYIIERPLDLLIYSPYRNEHIIADCKSESGKLTPDQKKFVSEWAGPWYLFRTIDDALQTVGATRATS